MEHENTKMVVELESLRLRTSGMLREFYDEDRQGMTTAATFDQFSILSTCSVLLTLDADPTRWRGLAINVDSILDALFQESWEADNTLQAALLVVVNRLFDPSCHRLKACPAQQAHFADCINHILSKRPTRQAGRLQKLSAYLRYWCSRALILLLNPLSPGDAATSNDAPYLDPALPNDALPKNAAARVALALERSAEVSYDDVCRQLAFRAAGDSVTFDVVVLAYSLITYVAIGDALSHSSPMTSRTRMGARNDARGAGSALPPYNPALAKAAIRATFDDMRNGIWETGQPIFLAQTEEGGVSDFVFSPDMVASMLEVLSLDDIRPHLDALQSHVSWLHQNEVHRVLPARNGAVATLLRGWRSHHLSPEGGPLAWCTAQAIRCIVRLEQAARSLSTTDILAKLGGTSGSAPDPSMWNLLLDSDLKSDQADLTLKSLLYTRMLAPLRALDAADALGRRGPGDDLVELEAAACHSAILFGPPGTAKTTIVAALAKWLGWGFVTIDTSVFLAEGLSNVASCISSVFNLLMQLERVVVLFDEIEEFCLDRTDPKLGMESRMLTTAMLTKLADLARKRRCAFFLATNRLRAMDAAVTRPGRFDLKLFVGTPNLTSRMRRFSERLAIRSLSSDATNLAVKAFECMYKRCWNTDGRFLTFLETERLAADAVDIVTAELENEQHHQPHLTKVLWRAEEEQHERLVTAFESCLDAVRSVMTVRDAVREEYIISETMSRC
eukprot:CAMPEP_0119316478 /NCGR_PEP_ID=MMETSP1333-20130426/39749_1 /TAXON_ID=418940 /ORGANISM="Scyphosphaera apsteinii, Strain RCC1455" /LENGTH=730 /DNA_ID=CAMNT_0007322131 /DNA_START=134 /DNA_END=2326 /DNA_ORIENTATION=+